MYKMDNPHVTLSIVPSTNGDPHRYNVCVEGFGMPDFAILAESPKHAKDLLKRIVYDALDHQEEATGD